MMDSLYFRQAELLLRVLPLVDREAVFALKGGSAFELSVECRNGTCSAWKGSRNCLPSSGSS